MSDLYRGHLFGETFTIERSAPDAFGLDAAWVDRAHWELGGIFRAVAARVRRHTMPVPYAWCSPVEFRALAESLPAPWTYRLRPRRPERPS